MIHFLTAKKESVGDIH